MATYAPTDEEVKRHAETGYARTNERFAAGMCISCVGEVGHHLADYAAGKWTMAGFFDAVKSVGGGRVRNLHIFSANGVNFTSPNCPNCGLEGPMWTALWPQLDAWLADD